VLATLGTVAVVYGGASASEGHEPSHDATGSKVNTYLKPTAPLLGNLLTLVASFGYGLYQVLYKIYAALPTDPEVTSDPLYSPIAQQGDDASADPDFDAESDPLAGSSSPEGKALYPPPFGLHPNLLTSIIGLITFFVLALFIPVLHITGVERFALPGDMKTVLSIAGIALGGMVFNAGFMVLLGVWGPIVTSVGNLLTIVLMLISDASVSFVLLPSHAIVRALTVTFSLSTVHLRLRPRKLHPLESLRVERHCHCVRYTRVRYVHQGTLSSRPGLHYSRLDSAFRLIDLLCSNILRYTNPPRHPFSVD
jgi:hypothetical protein